MRWSGIAASIAFAGVLIWGITRLSLSDDRVTVGAETVNRATAQPAGDGLIVHEWGTFTSFSGSDGVRLEFRPLVDEDLPAFVLDRFLQSGVANPCSKSQIRVRMRMETPVTYFYTNRERDVNVR